MKRASAFLLLLLFVWGCGSKVNKSNYDKIKEGMTLEEVQNILGDRFVNKGFRLSGGGFGDILQWSDEKTGGTIELVIGEAEGKHVVRHKEARGLGP